MSSRTKTSNGKWYKIGKGNNFYYTPFPQYVSEIVIAGDGTKPATPREMFKQIDYFINKKNQDSHSIYKFGDSVLVSGSEDTKSGVELPAGTYKYIYDNMSGTTKLVPITFRNDHYVKLSGVPEQFKKDFQDFLDSESIYRALNSIFKEGFFFYGSPGQGKTATIRSLVNEVMPKDSIAIVINKDLPDSSWIEAMRESLKDRLKIFIFEEFTELLRNGEESTEELLTFCDGENSLDRSVIIATSNYPERLPGNIVERPSRFDKFYEFDNPNERERKLLLDHYLMRESTQKEIESTKDLSIAGIKEIALLSHKRKISIEDAIKSIKFQLTLAKKKFAKVGKMGLG